MATRCGTPTPRTPVLVDDATSQLGLGRWSLYSATGANAPVEQGLDDVAALVADGAWHHVAVRLETLSTLDVFVDGVFLRRFSDLVASSGAASPGGKPIGSAAALGRLPFVFGGLVDTASGHEGFDGFVAQVAYYRRAVATEEIRNVMLNFAECEYGDGLVCLRLDEGYGTYFHDSSRFGEHPGFRADVPRGGRALGLGRRRRRAAHARTRAPTCGWCTPTRPPLNGPFVWDGRHKECARLPDVCGEHRISAQIR